MDIFTSINTAFAIKAYLGTIIDYFTPTVMKAKKIFNDDYFKYDMQADGDLYIWRDILGRNFYKPISKKLEKSPKTLQLGSMIEFDNANISRWVPLFPGKKYSYEGKLVMDNHFNVFPEGHDLELEGELISRNDAEVLSGSATVRLLPHNREYLLCASGEKCETGIPMVISEKVYVDKLQDIIAKEGCASGKIVGVLSEIPGEWKDRIDIRIGDRCFFDKEQTNIYGIPRFVVKVEEIKEIGSPYPISAQAWTQFINIGYNYTTLINSIFSPNDLDDVEKAIDIIANYKQFLESGLVGGKWEIDIEFDETQNWFNPRKYRSFKEQWIDIFLLYYCDSMGRIIRR